MVLFLHKKFLAPVLGGFVTGGFTGAIAAGISSLTGQKQRRVAQRVTAQQRNVRSFTSFEAAALDARRRYQQSIVAARPPRRSTGLRQVARTLPPITATSFRFAGPRVTPVRQAFQPGGRDQIIQLVRRFCR